MKPFNLDKEPKIKSGFTTPDNYFDDFTEKLMQQLPEREVKVVPLYKRATVWVSSIAAILVVALGVSIFFKMDTQTVAQPDATTLENYLVYQTDITPSDFIQGLDESDIKELEASIAVSDEAIENYFSNENYDIYINE
ncbi:hypothetical protein [Flavobacterium alkalisoli]|uniref:hypothetical protein n=1 Tax=Flavobacterium alkalisoli TaxID=2602769 RepID=UPI003A8FD543